MKLRVFAQQIRTDELFFFLFKHPIKEMLEIKPCVNTDSMCCPLKYTCVGK